MNRRYGPIAAAAFIALLVAVVPLIGVATPTAVANNETGISPGQQLGGVVDVGEAELETDVAGRAFGYALARADSPAAKAAVIKQRADGVEQTVESLEARLDGLRAARANGSLSAGAYRSRVAGIAAERAGAAQLANATATASEDLPAAVLEANGVNVNALRQLRDRSRDLGGEEVSAIAREVAGPAVGRPAGPPGSVPGAGTTGGIAGNGTGSDGPPGTARGPPTDRSRNLLVRLAE